VVEVIRQKKGFGNASRGYRKVSRTKEFGPSKKKPGRKNFGWVKRKKGDNNQGRRVFASRGGGHKRRYRKIDFKQDKKIQGKIVSLEHDPNRSAYISQVNYSDGAKKFVLAAEGFKKGMALPQTVQIADIPVGSFVYNVEIRPGKGAQLVRSAGVFAKLISHEGKYASIRLPSKKVIKILTNCTANIGQVSNKEHALSKLGKAGRNRWLGNRPVARKKRAKFRSSRM